MSKPQVKRVAERPTVLYVTKNGRAVQVAGARVAAAKDQLLSKTTTRLFVAGQNDHATVIIVDDAIHPSEWLTVNKLIEVARRHDVHSPPALLGILAETHVRNRTDY